MQSMSAVMSCILGYLVHVVLDDLWLVAIATAEVRPKCTGAIWADIFGIHILK